MGIFDRFRPAWKNSDATVRREAVTALGADDLPALAEVLRKDPDASVRRAAVGRVAALDLLDERATQDEDAEVRALAAGRADQLRLRTALEATGEAEAREALAALALPKSLAEVARKAASKAARREAVARVNEQPLLLELTQAASDPEVRKAAFARISEPQLLKHLALHEGTRELQLQAVARLEDLDSLETISTRAPVKAVRAAAAEKLRDRKPALQERVKPPDAQQVERQRQTQKLAEIEARRQREADEARARREAEAGAQTAAAAAAETERRAEEERVRAARKAEADARRAEQEARRSEEQAAREAEAQRRREEQAAREATRNEEEQRYVEAAGALLAKLEPLRDSDDRKALEEALQAVRALAPLRGRAGEAAEQARQRLEEAKATMSARLNDLREAEGWRRWANAPKFEALIAAAETLLASPEQDAKQLAQQLKTLQAEWKALGAPPREKADVLWGRFRELADRIHERVQHGFAVLDSERAANLEKKLELVARAEAAADSTDWKATADLMKQLQEAWKAIGPVPRDDAEAVWQRFRAACDKFFAARKVVLDERDGDRTANLARLVVLCERAEGLKGSTDWKGTADALKALQAEWKAVGPAGKTRAEADEVWQRFRVACDAFFERRKAAFALEDEKREANLKKKQEILARAEALADGEEAADPDATIRGLMAEWKQVGHVPREQSDELWSRFRAACDKIRSPSPVDDEAMAALNAGAAFSNRPLEALGKPRGD
jgi:hypothetical protein